MLYTLINQNYNKLLERHWLSPARLISALIGQCTRPTCNWTVIEQFKGKLTRHAYVSGQNAS